jgi:subtilase family serine protease
MRAGTAAHVRFVWKASRGRHTFTGLVDPRNRIAESNVGDNRLVTHRRGQ